MIFCTYLELPVKFPALARIQIGEILFSFIQVIYQVVKVESMFDCSIWKTNKSRFGMVRDESSAGFSSVLQFWDWDSL